MSTKSPELYLSPDQRALLLAALNSNSPLNAQQPRSSDISRDTSSNNLVHKRNQSGSFTTDKMLNNTSINNTNSNIGNTSLDTSSFFTDNDAFADIDYSLDMSLPDNYDFDFGSALDGNALNEHEKRKLSSDSDSDSDDPHESDPKRREGDDKTAKKPGRKPITNEPTSKRKAQNRAAQRAFRERKEKHLKDLEEKVKDLEKVSENTTQENKALKDQVDKLQSELVAYRKRFSLSGTYNRSPSNSVSNNNNSVSYDGMGSTGGFNFDFPLFGSFSQSNQQIGSSDNKNARGSVSPTNYKVGAGGVMLLDRSQRPSLMSSPQGSNNGSPAIKRNNSSSSNFLQSTPPSTTPTQVHRVSIDDTKLSVSSNEILADLFSPSILQAVSNDPTADYMTKGNSMSSVGSTPHLSSVLDWNSNSPSASSVSQQSYKNGHGNTSSCGTSPEAMDQSSPASNYNNGNKTDSNFGNLGSISEEVKEANPDLASSFSWLAQQNGGSFEPVLYNDYRDPTEQFNPNVGMSYFDDAFPSAFDLTLPPTPPATDKPNSFVAPGLIEDNGDDEEVVPGEDTKNLLACNQIWDKVQTHPKFVSGEIDMDNLCSELKAKVKCSEKGAVIDKKDLNKILDNRATTMQSMWGL